MFDRSLTLFTVRGIPIRLHFSLLLFIPYIVFATSSQFLAIARSLDLPRAALHLPPLVWGGIIGLGLLASIVAHELAHCAVAVASGTRVSSITLMILGGVSRMQSDVPPEREAWMALAGPVTSFGLALANYAGYLYLPALEEIRIALLVLAILNLALGIFNLLPAFPMDGGRVLRGLLSRRLGQTRATQIATTVGKVMAGLFVIVGLVQFNLLLALIGWFVYVAASAERERVDAREVLRGVPVSAFMTDRLDEAAQKEPVGAVARRVLSSDLAGARVVDDVPMTNGHHAKTVGVVTSAELSQQAARNWNAPVQSAMHSDLPRVSVDADATEPLDALSSGAPAVLVVDGGHDVVGMVTPREMERAVALGALAKRYGT
jgi:Zn-dependent protease